LRRRTERTRFAHHDILNLARHAFRIAERAESHVEAFGCVRIAVLGAVAHAPQHLAKIVDLRLQLRQPRLHHRRRFSIGHQMERERLIAFRLRNFADGIANLRASNFGRERSGTCGARERSIEQREYRDRRRRCFEKTKSRPPGRLL